MKVHLVIAGLLGFLFGMGARHLSQPQPKESSGEVVKQSSAPPVHHEIRSEGLATLQWGLRGNLNRSEILALPSGATRLAETALWALDATSEELAAHWKMVLTLSPYDYRELNQLMAIWVARDSEGALAAVRGTPQEYSFYTALAKADPEKALSLITSESRYYQGVLQIVAENDPHLVLDLDPHYYDSNHLGVVDGIAAGLFKESPFAALNFLRAYRLNTNTESKLLLLWATEDPQRALTWALETKSWGAGSVMPFLMEEHSDFLASEISKLPTGRFKSESLSQMAGLIAKSDLEKALHLTEDQPVRVKADLLASIGTKVVENDPAKATEILTTIFELNASEMSRGSSLELPHWSTTLLSEDPAAILKIAKSQSPDLESKVIKTWSEWNPGEAKAYFESRQASLEQIEIFKTLPEEQ